MSAAQGGQVLLEAGTAEAVLRQWAELAGGAPAGGSDASPRGSLTAEAGAAAAATAAGAAAPLAQRFDHTESSSFEQWRQLGSGSGESAHSAGQAAGGEAAGAATAGLGVAQLPASLPSDAAEPCAAAGAASSGGGISAGLPAGGSAWNSQQPRGLLRGSPDLHAPFLLQPGVGGARAGGRPGGAAAPLWGQLEVVPAAYKPWTGPAGGPAAGQPGGTQGGARPPRRRRASSSLEYGPVRPAGGTEGRRTSVSNLGGPSAAAPGDGYARAGSPAAGSPQRGHGGSSGGSGCRQRATLDVVRVGGGAGVAGQAPAATASGSRGRLSAPLSSGVLASVASTVRSDAAAHVAAPVGAVAPLEVVVELPPSGAEAVGADAAAAGAAGGSTAVSSPESAAGQGRSPQRPAPLVLERAGSMGAGGSPPAAEGGCSSGTAAQQQAETAEAADPPPQRQASDGGPSQPVAPKAAPTDCASVLPLAGARSALDGLRARRQARAAAHGRGASDAGLPSPTRGGSSRGLLGAPWGLRSSNEGEPTLWRGGSADVGAGHSGALEPCDMASGSGSMHTPSSVRPALRGSPFGSAFGSSGAGSGGGLGGEMRRGGHTTAAAALGGFPADACAGGGHSSPGGGAAAGSASPPKAAAAGARAPARHTLSGSGRSARGGGNAGGGAATAGAASSGAGAVASGSGGPAVAAHCYKITPGPGGGALGTGSSGGGDTITYIKYTNLELVCEGGAGHEDPEVGRGGAGVGGGGSQRAWQGPAQSMDPSMHLTPPACKPAGDARGAAGTHLRPRRAPRARRRAAAPLRGVPAQRRQRARGRGAGAAAGAGGAAGPVGAGVQPQGG
jgi:hypothetical protein